MPNNIRMRHVLMFKGLFNQSALVFIPNSNYQWDDRI